MGTSSDAPYKSVLPSTLALREAATDLDPKRDTVPAELKTGGSGRSLDTIDDG